MLRRFSLRNWFSRRQPQSPLRQIGQTSSPLALEPLETRLVPVVGAMSWAPTVARGTGYDGVVRLNIWNNPNQPGADALCTGSLLQTGRHILTAAHCLTNGSGVVDTTMVDVIFQMPTQNVTQSVYPEGFKIPYEYDGSTGSPYDIALLELPSLAPSGPSGGPNGLGAERYDIYRGSGELGQSYEFAGYGLTGTGNTGQQANTAGTKRWGMNHVSTIQNAGRRLGADFDSGSGSHNAHGDQYYMGSDEAATAQGDSGGGLVFPGRIIAGVCSYTYWEHLESPSRFGDQNFFTRVSYHADWIDGHLDSGHNLVLDMTKQIQGGDFSADTIEARVNGVNLELWVNNQLYQSEPLNKIIAVVIKGSLDNETITVPSLSLKNIFVTGGPGFDDLIVNGTSGADDWTLQDNKITTGGIHGVQFESSDKVHINTLGGADTIRVVNTVSFVDFRVNGGDQDDVIWVGQSTGNGWVLDGLNGALHVDGGNGGGDLLILIDEGQSAGKEYRISQTAVTRTDMFWGIIYASIDIQLKAGNGADTFKLLSTPPTAVELWGGNGSDTLVGLDNHNYPGGLAWSIIDYNKVSLFTGGLPVDGTTALVENVQGGSGADQFLFSPGKSISGNLDGGGGVNKLSYSSWSTDISANLRTGKATGVFGSISNIRHVIGGSGDDILVGDALSNQLTGGGGRDLLIGGAGVDWLDGGADDDLLIGGTTAYDTNAPALAAMRTDWTGPGAYYRRVQDMRLGGGSFLSAYKLDATTVFDDDAVDHLTGGTGAGMGLDWFWVGRGDMTDREGQEATN